MVTQMAHNHQTVLQVMVRFHSPLLKTIYIMEKGFYIEDKEDLLLKLRYHYDRDAYVF